ncbi:hypothetical protein ACFSOZ_30790 [Mesorhizobium newzealandense]|uniref:Uncharacterized protein n=1 Tax=Mesorhizobium newzealandense TaxID=1300302 RepID=A0ABW4UH32_9HYPH
MEKPVAGWATGFQKFDMLPGKIDTSEDIHFPHLLQARRIHRRFDVSWSLARTIAEHAFGQIGGAA